MICLIMRISYYSSYKGRLLRISFFFFFFFFKSQSNVASREKEVSVHSRLIIVSSFNVLALLPYHVTCSRWSPDVRSDAKRGSTERNKKRRIRKRRKI